MAQPPIKNPARFVPVYGVGYAGAGGDLNPVSPDSPLPVTLTDSAIIPAPLTGSTSQYLWLGPWVPAPGVPVMVQLSGDWQGLISVLRSTDNGATFNTLTVGGTPWAQFTANACEAVWEERDPEAQLWFEAIMSAGTVNYRMGH